MTDQDSVVNPFYTSEHFHWHLFSIAKTSAAEVFIEKFHFYCGETCVQRKFKTNLKWPTC